MDVDSEKEINGVIDAGADYVMLPYYKTLEEVSDFLRFVNGRATTILLLETKEAADILDETLRLPGVDEIHIGLNDLHLSLHQNFLFEPVADGLVEELCRKINATGRPYGFGGIARLHEGMIPAEMVLAEHYRMGSTRAILARSFCNPSDDQDLEEVRKDFIKNLSEIRDYEKHLQTCDTAFFKENQKVFQEKVEQVVDIKRKQSAEK